MIYLIAQEEVRGIFRSNRIIPKGAIVRLVLKTGGYHILVAYNGKNTLVNAHLFQEVRRAHK